MSDADGGRQSSGVDRRRLDEVDRRLREDPAFAYVRALVVWERGAPLLEAAYRGARLDRPAELHSVTKSVVSSLVGILVGEGRLRLDQPIERLVEVPWTAGDPRGAITVEHLLTMTAGLELRGRWDLDALLESTRPWVEETLDWPLVAAPGSIFEYDNGLTHVLAVIVERLTGVPLDAFAAERLFAPLGIERFEWARDPEGHVIGPSGLSLPPADLPRLGLLVTQGGVWRGSRLLEADYAAAAVRPASGGGPPEGVPYGFGWWTMPLGGGPVFFAGGWGGQYVLVAPHAELVVVSSGDAWRMADDAAPVRPLLESLLA